MLRRRAARSRPGSVIGKSLSNPVNIVAGETVEVGRRRAVLLDDRGRALGVAERGHLLGERSVGDLPERRTHGDGLTDAWSPCSTPIGRGATCGPHGQPGGDGWATQAAISRQRSGTCPTCCTVIDSGRPVCSTSDRMSAISSTAKSSSVVR